MKCKLVPHCLMSRTETDCNRYRFINLGLWYLSFWTSGLQVLIALEYNTTCWLKYRLLSPRHRDWFSSSSFCIFKRSVSDCNAEHTLTSMEKAINKKRNSWHPSGFWYWWKLFRYCQPGPGILLVDMANFIEHQDQTRPLWPRCIKAKTWLLVIMSDLRQKQKQYSDHKISNILSPRKSEWLTLSIITLSLV